MPHLRIEVSADLAAELDWKQLADDIHRGIATQGWAAINDLKTRVLVCADALAGQDGDAQQLVATLIITNPRPPEVQRAMIDLVLEHLKQAVHELEPAHWVQCCVFMQATDKKNYAKWQWKAPTPPSP
jgi:5-carboxymethyl-2-hydroxymuconate isomerase